MTQAQKLAELSQLYTSYPLSLRSRIINGGMRVAQRATSFTGTPNSYQTIDRFGCSMVPGGHTVAQVADAPVGFSRSMKVTVGTGAGPAAADFNGIWYNIEGNDVSDFAYGTANAGVGTMAFWVKASIAGLYALSLMNNGLNRNYITTYTVNNVNTWERKVVTFTGDTAGVWATDNTLGLSLCWSLGSGSNFAVSTPNVWGAGQKYTLTSGIVNPISTSGATFQITGLSFAPGPYDMPFEQRPFPLEMAMCQRYYQQIGGALAQYGCGGVWNATTGYVMSTFSPMRIAPACVFSVLSDYRFSTAAAAITPTGFPNTYMTPNSYQIMISGSGMTPGQAGMLQSSNSATSFLGLNAEI